MTNAPVDQKPCDRIIGALADAYPAGLSQGELKRLTGCNDPRAYLVRFLASFPAWSEIIRIPPGRGWGIYRLKAPADSGRR